MSKIKWLKLLSNPYKYYKVYKRKERLRVIKILSSVRNLWSQGIKVDIPLFTLGTDPCIDIKGDSYKFNIHSTKSDGKVPPLTFREECQ